MKIKILGPSPSVIGLEKIGDYLKSKFSLLNSEGRVMILAALLNKNVFSALHENLPNLKNKTKMIVGIELKISKDSFNALYDLFRPNVFVYYNPKGFFFHPKLYIIKLSAKEGIIVIGSSNFTLAGCFENLEINLALELDLENSEEKEIFDEVVEAFDKILTLRSIKRLTKELLSKITSVRAPKTRPLLIKKRIHTLSDIFKSDEPEYEGYTNFVMTLSYNDVSGKRSDKYIRIPKRAVEKNKSFWGWKNKFSPSQIAGFPERDIPVVYEKKTYKYRIYYVPGPREMRLVFPQIYTLGKNFMESILWIKKTDEEYKTKLIKKDRRGYKKLLSYCMETCPRGVAKVPKRWGYFYS